ncbi:sodium:phosphate symporter [Stenotrophomonas sp. Leaf70]|uniref:Sodium:phosphate symporter n=1 Tax=Stenotrophomonas nitritireducens TaxID=83617 RepID=A0ABR5NHK4_9GAMM|nr:sodium:phosphate symporter [Stenotrophomonas sp. Leaf70]KRG55702.1 sodium:phosphate symporter [Stenotrophomonas nitritireducens]
MRGPVTDGSRRTVNLRILLALAAAALLAWSFWHNGAWLQLCAGLAVFLFGMQILEEGLKQLAGGSLERLLARGTSTPLRGLLFGVAGTAALQSSTLVSLLAIAFISSGLIQLAGGIAIIFGANLGATSGIWLLALAGQNLSLSPLALPMLVFGVLAGIAGERGKAAGRVVLGVALVFLGIDQIKAGFDGFGGGFDLAARGGGGMGAMALFVLGGLLLTVVLQSSHATLMLTLAALASGQLQLEQSLAIAIGSNVGSSVSTAAVGMLGGNRSGQRLALAHVLFNMVTALLAFALLVPLTWLVAGLAGLAGFGGNPLLQLALFHTLFNAGGVALFWPWQGRLAQALRRWLPERSDTIAGGGIERVRARHLSDQALESADAAAAAVALELEHLGGLSVEVICQALCLPVEALDAGAPDPTLLEARPDGSCRDAETLYQQRVKGVYGDLLRFMGRLEVVLDADHQRFWSGSQAVAARMVDAVKDAKHLQKNLGQRLQDADSPLRAAYVELRGHLFGQLHGLRRIAQLPAGGAAGRQARQEGLEALDRQAAQFDAAFRQRLFAAVKQDHLDGLQAGSLLNDLGYVRRIHASLRDVVAFTDEPGSLRDLRRSGVE